MPCIMLPSNPIYCTRRPLRWSVKPVWGLDRAESQDIAREIEDMKEKRDHAWGGQKRVGRAPTKVIGVTEAKEVLKAASFQDADTNRDGKLSQEELLGGCLQNTTGPLCFCSINTESHCLDYAHY